MEQHIHIERRRCDLFLSLLLLVVLGNVVRMVNADFWIERVAFLVFGKMLRFPPQK